MQQAESTAVAPISAWILAAALTLLAVGAAWYAVTAVGVQLGMPFTAFNRARIESFEAAASKAGARRILLLGSSALKYATRDEDDFASGVARAIGAPVAVLRLSSNWGTFYDFAPLAPELVGLRPDLVVMEDEVLATDRPAGRRFELWLGQLRQALGLPDTSSEVGAPEADVQFSYPCWQRKASHGQDRLLELRADWVLIDSDAAGPRAARRFAHELIAGGATVVSVAVPRRPDYEHAARATRDAASKGLEAHGLAGRMAQWRPEPLDRALYCDLTHVNPGGQARFSDWLETRVAAELLRRGL